MGGSSPQSPVQKKLAAHRFAGRVPQPARRRVDVFAVRVGFLLHVSGGFLLLGPKRRVVEPQIRFGGRAFEEVALSSERLAVACSGSGADLSGVVVGSAVACACGVRVDGDLVSDIAQRPADEAVAVLDPVIKERQRKVTRRAVDPQRDLAQLNSERVDVDAVDAVLEHVSSSSSQLLFGGLRTVAAHVAKSERQPVDDRYQKRPGPAGRVDHSQVQDRGLSLPPGQVFASLLDQTAQRDLQSEVHQIDRRVVGAELAVADSLQVQAARRDRFAVLGLGGRLCDAGGVVQQALIDGA